VLRLISGIVLIAELFVSVDANSQPRECPNGYYYSATERRCVRLGVETNSMSVTKECMSGYVYNRSSNRCERASSSGGRRSCSGSSCAVD
jgi:hypothetical protein